MIFYWFPSILLNNFCKIAPKIAPFTKYPANTIAIIEDILYITLSMPCRKSKSLKNMIEEIGIKPKSPYKSITPNDHKNASFLNFKRFIAKISINIVIQTKGLLKNKISGVTNNNKKINFPRFKKKLFLSYIHNPKNAEGKNSNNKNILSICSAKKKDDIPKIGVIIPHNNHHLKESFIKSEIYVFVTMIKPFI